MSAWTTPIKFTAAKRHVCDWCGEHIESGRKYWRWRWFSGGDAATCKAHPECYAAMLESAEKNCGDNEFTPGENPRGCNCGHELGCEKCAAIATERAA